MTVALLVGGPFDGHRVRADVLDPHGLGSLSLQYDDPAGHRGVATYWQRKDQPELWDWRP